MAQQEVIGTDMVIVVMTDVEAVAVAVDGTIGTFRRMPLIERLFSFVSSA